MNGPDECVPCAGPGARINDNGECDCTPQFAEFLEEGTGAQIDLLIRALCIKIFKIFLKCPPLSLVQNFLVILVVVSVWLYDEPFGSTCN